MKRRNINSHSLLTKLKIKFKGFYQVYKDQQSYVSGLKVQHGLKYDLKIILEKLNADSHILDIGCRGGELVDKLRKDGYANSFGMDIGDGAVGLWDEYYGKSDFRAHFKQGDIHDGTPFNKKFDFIIMSHVLEHVFDIDKVIEVLKNSLNPNGFLFVVVPTDIVEFGFNQKKAERKNGAHFVFFESNEDLASFFDGKGFDCLNVEQDKYNDILGYFQMR